MRITCDIVEKPIVVSIAHFCKCLSAALFCVSNDRPIAK